MQYKAFEDLQLSALGMGAMRLPVLNGNYEVIDQQQVNEMVDAAMASGINYYDTAFGYHNGQSEVAIGKALARYDRSSYYLADKFPGYDLSNMGKVEEIFEEQLKRAGVEYFDFYLFHNVYEKNVEPYLDEKYGILPYLLKQKAAGRIRHLGFSCHGKMDVLERFLNAYGEHMEFCQLQINYLDWDFQDAKDKVALLNKRNLPVWVMEPLRGGKLAALSEDDTNQLRALRPNESTPAWAFRFLQGVPGVTMILSGMSSMQQMQENIATFATDAPLNETEKETILGIARRMASTGTLPCTACRYCTTHCPKGLDIPNLIRLYNEHVFTGGGFLAPMAVDALPEDKRPSACLHCRRCEAVCPQQIKVSEMMTDFTRLLTGK